MLYFCNHSFPGIERGGKIHNLCSMQRKPIYLDYNSTTPVDERVLEYMLPYFTTSFGNASSRQHAFGWEAAAAVELAREQVAGLIGSSKEEVIFTSGATESVNMALRGVFARYQDKGTHIVTCATEHPAVLDTCSALEAQGAEVTVLGVDDGGMLDLEELRRCIRKDTILVAMMAANNETGVLHPLTAIADLCHEKGTLFFTDATQAVGKVSFDVGEAGIDLAALSAHKFYGPKGCGALYVRKKRPRVSLLASMTGGGQETGLRSGTLNVPGIAGMGKAAEIAHSVVVSEGLRLTTFRNKLELGLSKAMPGLKVNGNTLYRLPGVSNVRLPGLTAVEFMMKCPELAISAGSACASANPEPSHVLRAMHNSEKACASSIRVSLGRQTTEAELSLALIEMIAASSSLPVN